MNRQETRSILLALCAGDCLGSTSEFKSPGMVGVTYDAKMADGWPFVPVAGGPFGWSAGESTDDGDQAYAMVKATVLNGDAFDPSLIADELHRWVRAGPKDVGGTTAQALSPAGVPWDCRGLARYRQSPENSANGSLMRNGVVVGFSDNLHDLFRYTIQHAVITHYDPLSVFCCCFQTWALHQLLHVSQDGFFSAWDHHGVATLFESAIDAYFYEEKDEPVNSWRREVKSRAKGALQKTIAAVRRLEGNGYLSYDPYAELKVNGQGYSLMTLQIALWAMRYARKGTPYPCDLLPTHIPEEPFDRTGEDVLGWVAMLGGDSDTYGSTAAPLIAAACGGTLPIYMTEKLEVIPKIEALYAANPEPTPAAATSPQ